MPGTWQAPGRNRHSTGTRPLRHTPTVPAAPPTQLPLPIALSRSATFGNFIPGANGPLVVALEGWNDGRTGGELFYLWGSAGSGRSHLLAAAGNAAGRSGLHVAYLPLAYHAALSPAILEGLGIAAQLDAIVLPSDAGAAKPDQRIFALALERIGVAASEALFVGDDAKDDLEGAHAAGLRAVDATALATLSDLRIPGDAEP